MIEAYVLAGELAAANGDYEIAFAQYEKECRGFAEMNQELAFTIKEMQIPTGWDEVTQRLSLLNALKESATTEVAEGSMVDVVQTAANAMTLKEGRRES